MAKAPNTDSTLSLTSGINQTSTSISTNIVIMVGNSAVGAIQSMQIGEKRPIKQIDEVGTDGHVDSVPNQSTNITGTCQRIRFDRLRITEAFGRGFVHAASQVYPFDIIILDKQKRAVGSQVMTVIKNVWIGGLDYTYQTSDWVISESMTWEAERIYSHLASGGNTPVAVGGERGIQHMGGGPNGSFSLLSGDNGSIVNIEQLADTGSGGRGGGLDAGGLIDLGIDGSLLF